MKLKILVILDLFFLVSCFGQEPDNFIFDIESMGIENNEAITDQFTDILQLNINKASIEEFLMIPGFNIKLANSIVNFRDSFGMIYSKYQLQCIEGWTKEMIIATEDYFQFPGSNIKQISHHFYLLKLKTKRNLELFPEPDRINTSDSLHPLSHLNKYRYKKGRTAWGYTLESDAGENIFDFTSFHFMYQGENYLEKLIIGDYRLSFGRGIALDQSYGSGKFNSSFIPLTYHHLNTYSSSNEYNFQRGLGAEFQLRRFLIIPFISVKSLDGNSSETDSITGKLLSISSIKIDGLHITNDDLAKKGNTREIRYGSLIYYRINRLKLGLLLFNNNYNVQIDGYQKQDMIGQGTSFLISSLSFRYYNKKMRIEGEISKAAFSKIQHQGEILYNLYEDLYLKASTRQLDAKKIYYFSNSGGETSQGYEKGILFGFSIDKYVKKFDLLIDFYKFPEYLSEEKPVSSGQDIMIRYSSLHRGVLFRCMGIFEQSQSSTLSTEQINLPGNDFKVRTKADIQFNLSENTKLKYCYQQKLSGDIVKLDGFLMYFQLQYSFGRTERNSILTRYTLYNIDGFSNRIYSWENDVLYSVSMPSYYGSGQSFFVMGKLSLSRSLKIWLRYSKSYSKDIAVKQTFTFQLKYDIKSA